MVIGSHKYYPLTFSENLKSKLQLVCADTRGFIPTSSNHTESDFTVDKILQDMEAMRVSLGSDKVILMGHSIHAFMALEYAGQFPDRVSHLVLIASSPLVGPEIYKEAEEYFEAFADPGRKSAFAQSMEHFIAGSAALSAAGSSSTSGTFAQSRRAFVKHMLAFGPRLWYDYNFDATKL